MTERRKLSLLKRTTSVNQEVLDAFLVEFTKTPRTERYKIIQKIQNADENVYQDELTALNNKIFGMFPSTRTQVLHNHTYRQIFHADKWFTFDAMKTGVNIWPDKENIWNRAGAIKVYIGKAKDNVLKAKMEKAINMMLAKTVIES